MKSYSSEEDDSRLPGSYGQSYGDSYSGEGESSESSDGLIFYDNNNQDNVPNS
jgi:hypothetical protein